MFVCVGTMAATFYNQANVNGAIEQNAYIPAMVQSKVKVHNILSLPRGIWELVFYFDVIFNFP